ncbi:hypothetical protein EGW08_015747, partial [Elysia chlorotica]
MAKLEKSVYTNPNSDITATNSEEPEAGESERPRGIVRLFSKFATRCSISGMPFITKAENSLVRTIWSCLLLAAFGLMSFHLYKLIVTYFEYKKQTEVQLSFSNLQFPAVTVCNVNPLRMSQRDLASPNVSRFIDKVHPDTVSGYLDAWTPDLEDLDEGYFEDEDFYLEDDDFYLEGDEAAMVSELKNRPKKENSTTKKDNKQSTSNKKPKREKVRNNNFFDEINIVEMSEVDKSLNDYFLELEMNSWESESEESGFYEMERKFRKLYALEPSATRAEMGHQINDMLLQCSFSGRKCYAKNFTRLLTSRYGNCYTLEYPKFFSRSSNPSDGLQLKLFLETDDYIPGIATSKGVQVVVHDQGTLPFPEEDGMAVQAGTETFIGLRRV